MNRTFVFAFFFLSLAVVINGQDAKRDYLKKVLGNLEKIESASYRSNIKSWEPGDTIPGLDVNEFYKEYRNPKDTTIGSSFVVLGEIDTTKFDSGYNGEVKVTTYDDKKIIVIDDFTHRNLPFRLVGAPFFNYTENIIKYALGTTDSITTDLKESGDSYYFKLTIHEDAQVEFFGKAYHMPKPPFDLGDPTSQYELWISKSNGLPYKYRREMSHNISVTELCPGLKLNNLSIKDFDLFSYFPKDYEIRKYGENKNKPDKSELLDKKAPDWTLKDAKEEIFSLSDFKKSKVLLVQCTGIGCGPCMASIPFLNRLKQEYKVEDLDVVAIETWNRKAHSLQNYANKHHIGYTFLVGNDAVVEAYKTGRAAPFFFVLDEQRVVKKVIQGYSPDDVEKEIEDAVKELLAGKI